MRNADALSLARTLMAAGARVQDRTSRREDRATTATVGDRTLALTGNRTIGEAVEVLSPEWDDDSTVPRTTTPIRFGKCAAFREGSQIVQVGASHTFR